MYFASDDTGKTLINVNTNALVNKLSLDHTLLEFFYLVINV